MKKIKPRAKQNRLDPKLVSGLELNDSRRSEKLQQEISQQNQRDNW